MLKLNLKWLNPGHMCKMGRGTIPHGEPAAPKGPAALWRAFGPKGPAAPHKGLRPPQKGVIGEKGSRVGEKVVCYMVPCTGPKMTNLGPL